ELLEYGKPPSDKLDRGRLDTVVAEAVDVCTAPAQSADIRLVTSLKAADEQVQMDYDRLLRVFVNLIENAIQYSATADKVFIATTVSAANRGRRWVECRVEDAGPGFKQSDIPLIFEPFFSQRRNGTGLGLAIVHRIVDEHRGEIEAGNRSQGGAIMTVRLPVSESV